LWGGSSRFGWVPVGWGAGHFIGREHGVSLPPTQCLTSGWQAYEAVGNSKKYGWAAYLGVQPQADCNSLFGFRIHFQHKKLPLFSC